MKNTVLGSESLRRHFLLTIPGLACLFCAVLCDFFAIYKKVVKFFASAQQQTPPCELFEGARGQHVGCQGEEKKEQEKTIVNFYHLAVSPGLWGGGEARLYNYSGGVTGYGLHFLQQSLGTV